MSLGLKGTQANTEAGLGTWFYNVPEAGIYIISVGTTVVPPSSLIITINQNGTPAATSPSPTIYQDYIFLESGGINCATNDVLTVVLTSSAAIDNQLQNVKSLINIIADTQHNP
jgi:hypothetical protein